MENSPNVSISQRLAIEKQLLREEKYIVHALKTVKEERHALQREGTDLLCLLREVLSQGKPRNVQEEDAQTKAEIIACPDTPMAGVPSKNEVTSSLTDEINLPSLDDIVSDEVELNLTVPSHNFYELMPEDEYEEVEMEDDYEIEMGMLMNGEKAIE